MKKVIILPTDRLTRSGKTIWDAAWHPSYEDWSEDDHEDASNYHFNQWETLYERLVTKYGTGFNAKSKYENNRRLLKHEANWKIHEKIKAKIHIEREIAAKKQRKIDKANVPLSKYEQEQKDEKSKAAKEFRNKKKNLSEENKIRVQALEYKLERLKLHHPQDSLHFGVSVSEERQELRAKIKSIIANSHPKLEDEIKNN